MSVEAQPMPADAEAEGEVTDTVYPSITAYLLNIIIQEQKN